ncbi:hypothetical protein YC2023_076495 [Brassica napus]
MNKKDTQRRDISNNTKREICSMEKVSTCAAGEVSCSGSMVGALVATSNWFTDGSQGLQTMTETEEDVEICGGVGFRTELKLPKVWILKSVINLKLLATVQGVVVHLMQQDNVKLPQTGVPGVRHLTFESLRLGRSSQSIVSNLLASGIP